MKGFIIFIICLFCLVLNAQDTIYKRTGEVISAKILEINMKEVSYKRADLPDGPLFIINKNDIKKIRYLTGAIDSFAVTKTPARQTIIVRQTPYVFADNTNTITHSYRRGIYNYRGHRLSDRNILFMALEKNQVWKNQEIDINIRDSRRNKLLQYTIGFSGAVLGGIGLYGAALGADISGNTNDIAIAGFAGILSAGILVSSQIVSFQYKLHRVKKADKVVDLYNHLSKIKNE